MTLESRQSRNRVSQGFAQPHLCLRRLLVGEQKTNVPRFAKTSAFGESFSTARGRRLLDGCVGSLLFSQQARAEEAWRIQNSMTFPTAQSNSCSFELLRQLYVLNTVLQYEPG